jgi:hypothetical protein
MAAKKKSKRSSHGKPRARKTTTRRSAKKRVSRVTRKKKPAKRKSLARRPLRAAPVAARPAKVLDLGAAPRCRSRIPVEVEYGGRRQNGAIVDFSASGARISGVHLDLPPGTALAIRYSPNTSPVTAHFVRVTEDGFAAKIVIPRAD